MRKHFVGHETSQVVELEGMIAAMCRLSDVVEVEGTSVKG